MTRQLIVLGTAAQAPTRHRNHNGYALRWNEQLLVFDPGEGFQRQCLLANLPISRATACLITHFHGDHSLGLSGFLQRRALDGATQPIPIWHPADGAPYLERLRTSTIWHDLVGIVKKPIDTDGANGRIGELTVTAQHLDHRVTTIGYRIQEPDQFRVDADRLHQAGVLGPDIGRLINDGEVTVNGMTHQRDTFGRMHRGTSMAFIMDTRLCDAAFELAKNVDLLVCESTYLEAEADLAQEYGHLTASQAATIATEAGADQLVLTHFSQRHPDSSVFVEEAERIHPNVLAANDLARISF